ncbi:MAG TPA: type II toxin-antitoxin system Phd/YefM family antitoxin, partial [Synergistaceae bacterium]|nr:type II toxin-antitoxin system Phd/YefM family antitoxin [Synergistaceae bacterium]
MIIIVILTILITGTMNMKTMTAVEAKTHFGKFLDAAQREPVVITKKNRAVGVMFSMEDIEDTIWAEKARKAQEEGYIGEHESASLITAPLH